MRNRQRGSTLVIAMMALLIFMGLAASMNFSGQGQANLASAVKLHQNYEVAALNVLNEVRGNLADQWQEVTTEDDYANDSNWRFGALLADAATKTNTETGNYPGDLNYQIEMNSGMLDLNYKVWVRNNPDDPAFIYKGFDLPGGAGEIDENWDLDGKIAVTVEIFASETAEIPVFSQTVTMLPVGGEYANLYEDAVNEGNESDTHGQGQGSVVEGDAVSFEGLEEGVSP